MKLPKEITVAVPDSTTPIRLQELPIVLIDSEKNKTVQAQVQLQPFFRPLKLWEGAAYDAVGDYTQAQAETRILELLGEDIPKSMMDLLYIRPSQPKS